MSTFPVSVAGGWSGDGTFLLTFSDPHNGSTMIEAEIPLETFTNALRNFHSFEPPLGTIKAVARPFIQYGWERQRGRMVIPNEDVPSKPAEFVEFVRLVTPRGWTCSESRPNMHHRSENFYLLPIGRTVEHGTPVEAEVPMLAPEGTRIEFPWDSVWRDTEGWGAR